MMTKHPWEILPMLVDTGILSREEAKGVVLAHEDANRRALQEIRALLPELVHSELLDPRGAQKIQNVVTGVLMRGMPDL